MVNAPGMPEAPLDAKPYGRRSGAWFDISATYLPLTGGAVSGEITSTSPTNYRIVAGNYGSFWLNDGGHHYLMLTNAGDRYGSYNTLRPFYVNLASGDVILGTTVTMAARPTWAGLTPWDNGNFNPYAYLTLGGGTMTGQLLPAPSWGGIASATANSGFEVRSGAAGHAAYMTLHRVGEFAVLFGLDTDNQLAYGGWSLGAARRLIWDSANFNPAAYAPVGGVPGNFVIGSSTHSTDGNIYLTFASDWLSNVLAGKFPTSGGTVSGNLTTTGEVHSNGILYSTGTMNSTTTNAVNVYINSSAGNFARSTSSADFKTALEPLEAIFADKVLDLQTVFYRPTEDTIDRTDWSRYGFIAENCYTVDPRFASCAEEDEKPIIHDLNAIVAALLDVVRRQGERIAALEAGG
jgi:hypothetical protein